MIGITWDKTQHSVGHQKLDEQHKLLLNLINQLSLQQSHFHGVGVGDAKGYDFILDELKKYVVEHLAYEEALLEQIGYEDLSGHKKSHQRFIDVMGTMTIDDDNSKEILVKFLAMWWDHHIMSEDMKYKPYLEKL